MSMWQHQNTISFHLFFKLGFLVSWFGWCWEVDACSLNAKVQIEISNSCSMFYIYLKTSCYLNSVVEICLCQVLVSHLSQIMLFNNLEDVY